MKKQVKKIIIVGGGSAGWMSAALLSKRFPDKEIALVESPDVPIIGVGESTLGTINQYLGLLGLKDADWMEYCNATYKMAIKFSHFYDKNDVFYYPFGIKDQQNCQSGINDWYIKKAIYPETPKLDFYESFYSTMPLIYQSKMYDNADGQLPGYSFANDVAYHMDAAAFGQFLKEKIALPNGVVHVFEHIEEIKLADDGSIGSILLRNGDELEADLYLDCTGFKSMLLGETLKTPFHSYSYILPNNKAWVTHVPYTDKEIEMENVTDCKAIENGWVWNIPLYNRIGSGYVFSNMFVTDEEALEEYKRHLDGPDMRLPKEDRSKDLEFRLIEIKNGVHDKCWNKNVVGVGLSYGFIEPLESTGLLSVQEILLRLCETLGYKTVNKVHTDNFNFVVEGIMDGFKCFVGFHYTLSARRDTDYWVHMTNEAMMNPRLLDRNARADSGQAGEMAVRLLQMHHIPGDPQLGGAPDIFVGMECLPTNTITLDVIGHIIKGRQGQEPEYVSQQTLEYWEQKKDYINKVAETAPSHYQYLKERIYNGKE
jgi:tryptophan halogenase